MRKISHRPRFEALESRALLSRLAVVPPEPPVAAPPVAPPAATHPIHLTGSIRGAYSPTGNFFQSVLWEGSSSISPLGHARDSGRPAGPYGSLNEGHILTTKTGKVFVQLTLKFAGNHRVEGDYTITGGSGAYSGATGSGHVLETNTGGSWQGKYTAVYS